jgi:hypothetical protein
MVALISRDGQFSACTVAVTKKLERTTINRKDLNRIDLLNRINLRIDAPVSLAAAMGIHSLKGQRRQHCKNRSG